MPIRIFVALILMMQASIFAAAWTGSTSEPQNTEEIDGKTFYVITTADELAWFAAQVNGGNNAINAVLGNDIVFGKDTADTSAVEFAPIGNSTTRFETIFDGRNKSIYGIRITSQNAEYTGENKPRFRNGGNRQTGMQETALAA